MIATVDLFRVIFVIGIGYVLYNFASSSNSSNASNVLNTLKETFYNIYPTDLIDPVYNNINEDPWDYKKNLRVGDLRGVDLNCNNVDMYDILCWIKDNSPHLLHQYVYRFDPSINIYNPIYAPRVLKMLLRNLPDQHSYLPILRKCFPYRVRIS